MQDGVLPGMIKNRYSTYSTGVGKKIRDSKVKALSRCGCNLPTLPTIF